MGNKVHVRCWLPNAGEGISGVRFDPDPDPKGGGRVSEPISAEQAQRFLAIPGYELADEKTVEGPDLPADFSTLSVGEIERMLSEQPHLADRVLADEQAARGDKARKGVLDAVEAAQSSGGEA